MVNLLNHGGYCCGMRHIQGFNGYDRNRDVPRPIPYSPRTETGYERLKRLVFSCNQRGAASGRLIEVVLTNQQCRSNPQLLQDLKEIGFDLVNRFRNANSRSICNIFHYNQGSRMNERRPFEW